MKYITKNSKQTMLLGQKLAKNITQGGCFGLVGDLGAGKTCFTKGIALGLGIKKNITSPTFVLMRVYPAKHKHIKQLVHLDAYRLEKAVSLTAIGLDDYLNDNKTLILVEWANKVPAVIKNKKNVIKFKHLKESREIVIPKVFSAL